MLGIGGGGDAVGSLAPARSLEALGIEVVLGGVAWERLPVDPYPGPRPLELILGAKPVGANAAVIDPEIGATTPEGAHFCESRLSQFLGLPTALIDITNGAAGAAEGIGAAAAALGCDLVCLIDIGGDAIAEGGEPGLASPLCDAVMIAAGARLDPGLTTLLGVLGAGCDGELLPAEVLARVSVLAEVGAWIETLGVSPEAASEIEAASQVAITEASLLVAQAARGQAGPTEIRGGRRIVELSPVAALCFLFDLEAALTALPLAQAVADAPTIFAARDALAALGVGTELDYELGRAAQA